MPTTTLQARGFRGATALGVRLTPAQQYAVEIAAQTSGHDLPEATDKRTRHVLWRAGLTRIDPDGVDVLTERGRDWVRAVCEKES